ncbi:MAG: hypothetical protein LQ348_004153 [Seirophora lacunosa]|nr:MAG: hypothetical protein LQ348_004153 [Seirophora lacunosa]
MVRKGKQPVRPLKRSREPTPILQEQQQRRTPISSTASEQLHRELLLQTPPAAGPSSSSATTLLPPSPHNNTTTTTETEHQAPAKKAKPATAAGANAQTVWVIRAAESWRDRSGKAWLTNSTVGAFRRADDAERHARAWLERRWRRQFQHMKEERRARGGGLVMEMPTDKGDGVVYVDIDACELR